MPWVRLHVRNDWGSLKVCLGPYLRKEYGMIANEVGAPVLTAGRYTVRWPNGFMDRYEVVMRKRIDQVGDMGNVYDVHNQIPHLVMYSNGARLLLMLARDDCPLKFWAEEPPGEP